MTTDRDYADKRWLDPQPPEEFTAREVVLLALVIAFGLCFGIALMHLS